MANYYKYGETGRGIALDSNGKLLLNANPSATGDAFEYGTTGRKIKVDSDGKLLVDIEGVFASGNLKTNEVLAAVDLTETGGLYHQTFNHALGDRFVTIQYYDTSTYESAPSGVYHVLTDANNAEIWTPTSGDLGVIATR